MSPTNFSEDAPPVPLKLVVLAGAQQVEHDATETKFCELISKSVHTGNSENSARKGQQKFEGFRGARERREGRASRDGIE